jgi:hypothetical protein
MLRAAGLKDRRGTTGMIHSYVALTALTDCIRSDELAAVAAALQTQVSRDFAPEWGINAVVAAFPFEAIPAGYTPLMVQDTMEAAGTNGFHRTRGDDSPYIMVPHGPSWSLSASHELLRMLANPTGSARVPGTSRMQGQGTVEYLVDVCAPCQDISAAYTIDGLAVTDFCTPAFFAGVRPGPGRQALSFNGTVGQPFEPSPGGIVTWLADDALLYQARADQRGRVQIHGGFSPANRAKLLLRELVDSMTPDRLTVLSNAPRSSRLVEAEQNARRMRFANLTRYQEDIAWRFGHASADASDDLPRRVTRRLKAYPADAKSGQQRASDEVDRTVRTAS